MSKKTMKEKYEAIVSKNYKPEDVVQFIAQQNAYLLSVCGNGIVTSDVKKEVVDFVQYFNETCTDEIMKALWNNYGRMPFIFAIANQFMWEEMICSERKYLSALSNHSKKVAKSLFKRLWNIRKDRILHFSCDNEFMKIEINHSVPADMINDMRTHLLCWCAKMINSTAGGLCVRTIDKDRKIEVFGIRAFGGKWEPLTSEEIYYAHTYTPDGTRIEAEKGVVYTDIRTVTYGEEKMLTSTNEFVLRKAAKRRGYYIKKSRKTSMDNRGGYMLIDANNVIIAGEKFDLTPEEVRDWLNEL